MDTGAVVLCWRVCCQYCECRGCSPSVGWSAVNTVDTGAVVLVLDGLLSIRGLVRSWTGRVGKAATANMQTSKEFSPQPNNTFLLKCLRQIPTPNYTGQKCNNNRHVYRVSKKKFGSVDFLSGIKHYFGIISVLHCYTSLV